MGLVSRVLAALRARGTSASPSALTPAASTIGTLPISAQISRIAGPLTPLRVSQILRNADAGYTYELCDLGCELRQKDCTLHAVLERREHWLGDLVLSVVPADESSIAVDAAALVERGLDGAIGGNGLRGFADVAPHLQSALFFAHADAETIWEERNGELLPRGWILHQARRFGYRESDGALVAWDQTAGGVQIEVQRQWPGRWLQYEPRVVGDTGAREGLIRPLVWAGLFRNWSTADWLKLAELSWKPWRMGTYLRDATRADVDELLDALEKMSSSGVVTHSERTRIEVQWPPGKGESRHRELCDYMAAEIAKCVLGQTLTTEQGERGARSLGEVHERSELRKRADDAAAIASVLQRDLASWIVRLNLGDAAPVPRLEYATEDVVDLKEFAETVGELTSAGIPVPVSWVYDRMGIPPEDTTAVVDAVDAAGPAELASGEIVKRDLVLEPEEPDEPDEPDEPEGPDLVDIAEAAEKLAHAGVVLSADDVRARAGFRAPRDGEAIIGGVRSARED